ncbi:uncharacterized protein LOC129580078 [Sitodiplosis mosellana]|uniref:uncharacterized protein LOC129580078 n=1 Tax=Sitodiplosis mosellana TaxID=263140 RepID=UPI002444DD45|nr:uncharacterized protein LOC129580078 [Sitodiplosis mosellana]
MKKLEKINTTEKFATPEELAQRINKVLYFATNTGCAFYKNFYENTKAKFDQIGQNKKIVENTLTTLKVIEILVQTACTNLDIIKESMEPSIITPIPSATTPIPSTTTPTPSRSSAAPAICPQPPSQQTSSATERGGINIYNFGHIFHFDAPDKKP